MESGQKNHKRLGRIAKQPYGTKLGKKRQQTNFQVHGNESQSKKATSQSKTSERGLEHLEYLNEKNALARKRLLDLQQRLLEINAKNNQFEDFKNRHFRDPFKESETLNLIQKYSSLNAITNEKIKLFM